MVNRSEFLDLNTVETGYRNTVRGWVKCPYFRYVLTTGNEYVESIPLTGMFFLIRVDQNTLL